MLVRRPLYAPDVSTASFDRAFQQLARNFEAPSYRRGPAVHWSENDGTLSLTVDLPGVPADAIRVETSGRTLTLAAEHGDVSWSRSIRLGARYDVDTVAAVHVDGRLTVTVGTSPAPEVRQIPVGTSTPAAAVEAAGSTQEPAGEANEG